MECAIRNYNTICSPLIAPENTCLEESQILLDMIWRNRDMKVARFKGDISSFATAVLTRIGYRIQRIHFKGETTIFISWEH